MKTFRAINEVTYEPGTLFQKPGPHITVIDEQPTRPTRDDVLARLEENEEVVASLTRDIDWNPELDVVKPEKSTFIEIQGKRLLLGWKTLEVIQVQEALESIEQ